MNKYKQSTDEIYTLFESFRLSGFNEDQALKLTEVYCRQSVLENILFDEKRRSCWLGAFHKRDEEPKEQLAEER